MLAHSIGVPLKELLPLLDRKDKVADIEDDDVWWLISEYVSKRLGALMAIRSEMNKQLQKERQTRALRLNRFARVHEQQRKLSKRQGEDV